MIFELDSKLISGEIFSEEFVCNLSSCKGACCVEGDRGAPLDDNDILELNQNIELIKPFMTPDGLDLLNKEGFFEDDGDDKATTCLPTGECVFAYRDQGILSCAIEKSYKDDKSTFYKPISCHLYPIRLGQVGEYESINYHQWQICKAACELGKKLKVPVFQFLKEPLIRKYGKEWYSELENLYQAYLQELQ
jgi:hypothetical protein